MIFNPKTRKVCPSPYLSPSIAFLLINIFRNYFFIIIYMSCINYIMITFENLHKYAQLIMSNEDSIVRYMLLKACWFLPIYYFAKHFYYLLLKWKRTKRGHNDKACNVYRRIIIFWFIMTCISKKNLICYVFQMCVFSYDEL